MNTQNITNIHPSFFAFKDEPKLKNRTMKSVENGELVWSRPNQIYKQQPMFSSSSTKLQSHACDALSGVEEVTEFSRLFFSHKNLIELQKMIRYSVYINTNKKYIIDYQNETELIIAMRTLYLENAIIPSSINEYTSEIKRLNDLLLSKLIPRLVSEIEQYLGYIKDSNNPYTLLDNPRSTSNNKNIRSASDILFGDNNFFGII